MKRLLACLIGLSLGVPAAGGQSVPWAQVQLELRPAAGVVSNTIQELAPAGDSLWIGPLLTVYVEDENRFLMPDDPAVRRRFEDDRNVVFSLATPSASRPRSEVWAGLAFDTGGEQVGAGGFLVSTDGGQSFDERSVHLDDPSDTTVTYGVSTLPAEPITREVGSAPQDLAIGSDTVWVAGARSGLRRSTDGGQTWSRVVLPPDTSTRIDPATAYDFPVAPPLDGERGFQNHVAFSVLVDEAGTVWAGTAAGVNHSLPADDESGGDRAWRRIGADGTPNGLPGQFVVALAEQPRPRKLSGRNPVWMATWRGGEASDGSPQRFGVAMTPDGGETVQQALIGERVNDLAARPGRVYAAAETGLFVSGDQGTTWRSIEEVPLEDEDQVLPGGITARAVAVTSSALWVGTTEGLLRLDRAEEPRLLPDDPGAPAPTWQLFRVEVPVNPRVPTEQVPDVATYAYPNPFIPPRDRVVRIVYEVPEPQTVEVKIYDFGMNLVRTLREQEPAGQQEMVWDGTDEAGLRLPTGTYLYTVELSGTTVRGKIVLSH